MKRCNVLCGPVSHDGLTFRTSSSIRAQTTLVCLCSRYSLAAMDGDGLGGRHSYCNCCWHLWLHHYECYSDVSDRLRDLEALSYRVGLFNSCPFNSCLLLTRPDGGVLSIVWWFGWLLWYHIGLCWRTGRTSSPHVDGPVVSWSVMSCEQPVSIDTMLSLANYDNLLLFWWTQLQQRHWNPLLFPFLPKGD